MIKTFGKLGTSHPEARSLPVASMPTAPGTPRKAPEGPPEADEAISLSDAWRATAEFLEATEARLKVEDRASWSFKLANYGFARKIRLAKKQE